MPAQFNLSARLVLQGPFGVKPVLDKLNRSLKDVNVNINVKVARRSIRDINDITAAVNTLRTSVRSLQSESRGIGLGLAVAPNIKAIDSLTQSVERLNKAASKTSAKANKTSNALSRQNAVIAATARGAAEAASEVEDFGRISGLAIRRFAGFTISTTLVFGLFNAIVQATKSAIDFERELNRIGQVTGRSQSGLRDLRDEVDRLSTSFGVSSTEILSSARTLSQAGFTANQVRGALEAIAKTDLAPTFNSIEQTTEGAIAAIRQFNLEVEELDGALGSINAVSKAFAVESSDLIGAIQRAGSVFATTQEGVEDASTSLQQFVGLFTSVRATTRESAETIAVALRTIFTRLQRRSTIDALRELNIELLDAQGKFVGGFEAVMRLNKGLKDLDGRDPRFASIVEELGGVRQIGKLIPLIQRASIAQEAFEVAQSGTGSLTDDQIRAQEALANKIDRTRESFLKLIRDLTNTETFDVMARAALGFADRVIFITDSVKELLPILGAAATIFAIRQSATFVKGLRSSAFGNVSGPEAAQQGDNTATIRAMAQRDKAARDANTSAQKSATQAIKENTSALQKTTVGSIRNAASGITGGMFSGVRRQPAISPQQAELIRNTRAQVLWFSQQLVNAGVTQEQFDAAVKAMVRSLMGGATQVEATSRAISASLAMRGRGSTPLNVGRGAGDTAALAERSLRSLGVPAVDPVRQEIQRVRRVALDSLRMEVGQSRGVGLGVGGLSGRGRTADIINKRAISAAEKVYISEIKKGATERKARNAALAAGTAAEKKATARIQNFSNKRTGFTGLSESARSRIGTGVLFGAPAASAAISSLGGGNPTSQALGAGVGGATIGGLIGSQVAPGIGTAVGAGIGGIATFVSTLQSASEDLARINLTRSLDETEKALQKFRKGLIDESALESEFKNAFRDIREVDATRTGRFGTEADRQARLDLIRGSGGQGAPSLTRDQFLAEELQKRLNAGDTINDIGGRGQFTARPFTDVGALLKDEVRDITEGAEPLAETINRILEDRIQRGIRGDDLYRGLGGEANVLEALGRTDTDTASRAVMRATVEGMIEEFIKGGEPLRDKMIELGDAGEDLRDRMSQINAETNLMASRFDALARSAQLASTSGNGLRAQIEDISSGFAGIANLNLRDITGNFDQIGRGEMSQRFDLLRSATGNDPMVQNLERVAQDIQFLSTKGVDLLTKAASQSDISGDSAEELINKIFSEGGFESLAPTTRKFFERSLQGIFGGRTGDDLNLGRLLEENPQFIQELVGDLGKVVNDATRNLSTTIESSANEYAASLNRIVSNQLQIASLQDKVLQVSQDSFIRRQELLGRDVSIGQVAAGRDDVVRRATASGGIGRTTDSSVIGAEIRRISAENRRLLDRRQASTDTNEITNLTNQLGENNRRATELNKALDTLASDTRELATIERKIAESESRRQAGRGFTSSLIGATLDPQQFRQMIQGVSGVAGIFGVGPITAEQFGAGEQLIQQISGLLGPDQARAFQDAAAEANLKRLEASGAPPELIKFLRGLDRRTEEQRLADQYKDVTDNQIKAIQEQQKILQGNTQALVGLTNQLRQQQSGELGGIGGQFAPPRGPANNQQQPPQQRQTPRGNQPLFDVKSVEEEIRRGRRQNFTGGLINGGFSKSRQDNKRINVQGGEFVVNRLATRDNRQLLEAINNGVIPGFVNGGMVGAGGRNTNNEANQSQLMNALTTFSSSATQLSQSLNNISVLSNDLNRLAQQLRNIAIPERIQIEAAPMQINVVFNGAEVLANIKPEMAEMMEQKIKRALAKAINPITGETNTRF